MLTMNFYGNLAKDAVVRTTQSGMQVTGFDVAVNDRRKNKTYWFSVSYWGKGGANIAPMLTKGTAVVVCGNFEEEEYNGKVYKKINAYQVTLAGKKTNEPNENYENSNSTELDDEIPF